MRLLPWSTVDGKPCYVVGASGDGPPGPVSRLADLWEARHLLEARTVLGALREGPGVLERADAGRLRAACVRLVWSLARVLRVADSRGERLGRSDEREAARLEMAWVLLGHARDLLITGHGEPFQFRYVVPRLAECLAEAVAVADARAALLAAGPPGPDEDGRALPPAYGGGTIYIWR
ncbi:hypothetical protein RKE29_07120 [Streptomyces sp. B1866]|uniref:hypothetical protein n=1 Tax=Streptomyces sp. B1866 TaxID=3075431 RepID=UPI0028900E8B|nr:hypothetical protein [Streptomyces sp. B1866]MDT3396413.1 hypothetical protein [Streptomyces sp. B1866]